MRYTLQRLGSFQLGPESGHVSSRKSGRAVDPSHEARTTARLVHPQSLEEVDIICQHICERCDGWQKTRASPGNIISIDSP